MHGGDVGRFLGRPKSLRDDGIARPDARIDIFRTDVFGPHAGFSAEDAGFFFGRETRRCATQRIYGVVARRRPTKVEVVTIRKNPAKALLGSRGERLRAAPRLDEDVLRQRWIENFIPADHALAMFAYDGLEPFVEIGLQALVV